MIQYSIQWIENTDSTNNELRRQIESLDNLSVIAACCQSQGRGQGNHTWYSTPGLNLTLSILYKYDKDIPATEAEIVTRMTCLGIYDYLYTKGISSRIKWPNDIWVGEKKICGILIENFISDKSLIHSIVGVGLNLNETSWPQDLPNPISLKELSGIEYNPKKEISELMDKIARRYYMYMEGKSNLKKEFESLVFRLP